MYLIISFDNFRTFCEHLSTLKSDVLLYLLNDIFVMKKACIQSIVSKTFDISRTIYVLVTKIWQSVQSFFF